MHFNKKIFGLSLATIMILTSCSTEDKYKANECINCLPSTSNNQDIIDNTDNNISQDREIQITFAKESESITWQRNHDDESTQGVTLSSQKAVVYTKWHNRLMIIDPTTKSIDDDKLFIDIVGDRDVIDTVSGASEQILAKVEVNNDVSSIYALVTKHSEDTLDQGVGIYSANINNGIPYITYASKENSDTDFFNYPLVRDLALSHDGAKLIAGGDDKKIKIFDVANLNNPIEINVDKKVRSLSFSQNDNYIFCGSVGLKNLIRIYDFTTRTEVAEIEISSIPLSVVEVPNANKIIALFAGSNKVRIYDITDINNPTLSRTLIINGSAKSISLSPDNKLFAIAATGKQVNLFAIEGGDTPKVITLEEAVNGVSFLSASKIMVTSRTSLEFFDITVSKQ